jgi:CheY-like chemotaxis protein
MARRDKEFLKSVLLVDDDPESLEIYEQLIRRKRRLQVTTSRYPGVALKLAQNHFFDMILIDVTMNYNGSPYGGFDLYKALAGRYGDYSLVLYSNYVNQSLLNEYGYTFNFFEKGDEPARFVEKILTLCNSLRRKQSCFVAMPFDGRYDPVFRVIKECAGRAGYRCLRTDEQAFTKSVVEKVFEEIRNSKIVIFLATGQNPNAFYECGYAVALNKEVVTLTDYYKNLPFDIRERNSIAYGEELESLGERLIRKLSALTAVPTS